MQHLDWPKGFRGDQELLDRLSDLINNEFRPYSTVESKYLTVTPGAAAGLDALLYTLCNDGDAVLVPTPYWCMYPLAKDNAQDAKLSSLAGYDAFFTAHSGVIPIGVDVSNFEDSLGPTLIDALEDALRASERKVRALVLSNPHNPLGKCYSKDMLQLCVKFCEKHDIHLISDEVFALSEFESPDLTAGPKFTSILSVDPKLLGADPNRIHFIWSLSKDFAASGIRLVSAESTYRTG